MCCESAQRTSCFEGKDRRKSCCKVIIVSYRIVSLTRSAEICAQLSGLLIETVAAGGSVSFMHPLSHEIADRFWDHAFTAVERGDRVIFGAFDGADLIATVTVLLDCPPNQPHRAEIAKLMTRLRDRGRGIASALMQVGEAHAIAAGRTLLVLDTATDGGASRLYERLGFTLAGIIPDYALKPHGGLTGTMIYWKRIGRQAG